MYLVRCSVLKPSQSYATIGRFGLYFSCSTLLAGERARSALFSVVEHDGTYTLQCHCARHSGVSHFILLSLSRSLARSFHPRSLPPYPPSTLSLPPSLPHPPSRSLSSARRPRLSNRPGRCGVQRLKPASAGICACCPHRLSASGLA